MAEPHLSAAEPIVIDERVFFTLAELCRACDATSAQVTLLVEDGVLEPVGATIESWRFAGTSLARARTALRLAQDLDLRGPAVAVVLDLIDEIERLRVQLRRSGSR